MLYKYIYSNTPRSLNFIVYRHFSDLTCSVEQMAEVHKIASFICDSEAKDYCDYRNQMTAFHGSDDVSLIRPKEVNNGRVNG